MHHTSPIIPRQRFLTERRKRVVHRKLPLKLYELEPESGEDENLHIDLDYMLDQLED
jgi:hypothetical protein